MTTINLYANRFETNKNHICNNLEAQLQHNTQLNHIVLNGKKGNGIIYCQELGDGIFFMCYDVVFNDDVYLNIDTSNNNPLYFIYTTQGRIELSFDQSKRKESLELYRTLILNSCKTDPIKFHFEKNKKKRMFMLWIDRERYQKKTRHNLNHYGMANIGFNKSEPIKTFIFNCAPDLLIADVISRYFDRLRDGTLSPLVLRGVSYIFMDYVLTQYQKEYQENSLPANLTENDLLRVQQSALAIKEEPAADYSVIDLSGMTGLNPFKLQKAFKYIFGRTAGDYIRNVRLEQAENLLKKSELTVSEIVVATGFNSHSYFSKIFKKKYNCCPKAYQKIIKATKRERIQP